MYVTWKRERSKEGEKETWLKAGLTKSRIASPE
jgi:hypothetical protein